MDEFLNLRKQMVDEQLAARGIKDRRVLAAMGKVPRHRFMPRPLWSAAYADNALSIGEGQTISQPYMVAIMTEALELKGKEKVLEIGTGSGYQAAILAELSEQVFSIERNQILAERAENVFKDLDYDNISILVGDGTKGIPEKSPFDRIIVTAAAPAVPPPLLAQLAEGGLLVIPIGDRLVQVLNIVRKKAGEISCEYSVGCMFVPLVGEYGWKE